MSKTLGVNWKESFFFCGPNPDPIFPSYKTKSELRKGLDRQDDSNNQISLRAVVLAFRCAFQTKGGDWMMAVSLIDDTNEPHLTAVMFSRDRSMLPKLLCVGDVLCLRTVRSQVRTLYFPRAG